MLTITASPFPSAGSTIRWSESDANWRPCPVEAEVLTYRDHGSFRVAQLRTGHRLLSAALVCEAGKLRIITCRSGIAAVEAALSGGGPMPADARVHSATIDNRRRAQR